MSEQVQIRGGAGEFEAAVIAVVLDRIAADEKAARLGKGGPDHRLPAWIRALEPESVVVPLDIKKPL
jgi:hypothetical protein